MLTEEQKLFLKTKKGIMWLLEKIDQIEKEKGDIGPKLQTQRNILESKLKMMR